MIKAKNYVNKIFIVFVMLFVVIGVQMISSGSCADAATVGQSLKSEESGWHRFNDKEIPYLSSNNAGIVSNGSSDLAPNCYKNDYTTVGTEAASADGSYVKFRFKGSKIRLIGGKYYCRSNDILFKIDGEEYRYDAYSKDKVYQCLLFEKNNLEYKEHTVEIIIDDKTQSCTYISGKVSKRFDIDAVDLDSDGYFIDKDESIKLNASDMSIKENETKQLTANTDPAKAEIVWSSSDENIAKVDEGGNVTGIKEGVAYITAKMKGSDLYDTCTVNVKKDEPQIVLNIEPEQDHILVNQNVEADLTIDNIKDIAAEDVRIKYDSSKLQFLGMNEVDGIKLVKSSENNDELRVILASEGINNVVSAKKTLLKLNFKGISTGEALVDITKGRVSDGIEMEKDLLDKQCGQVTITIEDYKDPNKDGAFTLLDLAIDGRYYGQNPNDYPEYKTDVVPNGEIDNDDLLQIGEYMLSNPNYEPNNY